MSSRATIGECKINTIEMTTNQGFISYECNEDLNNIFLMYLIGYYKNRIIKISSGSTFLEVSRTTMRNFKIPLPPLKEQEKIADILSTADDKIDAIASQIDKAETLKKGLLQKLLSEGIGHSEFKDSELGKIPASWEIDKLENICIKKGLRRGPFGGALKKDIFVSDGYKVYEQKNAIKQDLEVGNYYITAEKYDEMEAFQVKENDFLVSCSGTIGKIVKITLPYKEGIINQALLKITLNDKIDDDFFQFQFNSKRIQTLIIDNTQGGAMPNLVGMSIFKATKFIVPPLEEQKQIAEILLTADEKLKVLRAKKEKYETLKKGLLQKLLSGEVRV